MTQAKSVKKATTATAKRKPATARATKSKGFTWSGFIKAANSPGKIELVKSPIGWHFDGKRSGEMFLIDDRALDFNWCPAHRQVRKWKVAFWIAFAGFLAMSAMSLIK